MPPKRASPTRTKSPSKGAAKAPAGSSAVKKSAGGKSPSKSPSKVGGKKTAPAPSAAKVKASTPSGKKSSLSAASKETTPAKIAEPAAVPKIVFTKEEALVVLQATGRGFSDRQFQGSHYYRRLRNVIQEKSEAANTKRLLLERQRMKKEREITEKVEDKKEAQRKLHEQLCVAAFEGDGPEVKTLIEGKGANPLKPDSQGNYPIGEAAVNGQTGMVKLLIEKYQADPNQRGAFDRTPIWRAAYHSHSETIKTLLELGGDPRLKAQSQIPSDLASGDALALLNSWDSSKTDAILGKQAAVREAKEKEVKAEAEKELAQLADSTATTKQQYDNAIKKLNRAKQNFETRVFEYDTAHHEGKDPKLVELALGLVKEAEKDIEGAEKERDDAMNAYLDSKALENEHRQQLGDLPGTEVNLKSFADVVLKANKSTWKKFSDPDDLKQIGSVPSGELKWPLVIDCTDKVGMFLRYRDTNYVDAVSPIQMQPENLRKTLLGSIRYGKPMVLDLKDVPLVDFMKEKFDAIPLNSGGSSFSVWDAIRTREIMLPNKYLQLVKDEDGDRYLEHRFHASDTVNFCFMVVTTAFVVEEELLGLFTPFRVLDDL